MRHCTSMVSDATDVFEIARFPLGVFSVCGRLYSHSRVVLGDALEGKDIGLHRPDEREIAPT